MKYVWGALVLASVVVGSTFVWYRFGEQNVTFVGTAPRGRLGIGPPQGVAPTEGNILAAFGKAPDFSLTERNGKPFSKSDLKGSPWIADFIFTSCSGQCPLMSAQMKSLQNKFGPESGFRFASFSVDPDRDTPEVLSQYADRYEAQKQRWFFLTGPRTEINRVLKEFFLSPVDQPAMHSIRFILVDGEGQIRGYYDSSDPQSMNQLMKDAQNISKSAGFS